MIDGLKSIGGNLTQGAHNIAVFNTTTSSTVYFTVNASYVADPTPPNITHLAPANLTKIENRNFSVQVNASDNVGLDTLVVDFGGVNVTKTAGLVNGSNNITLTGLNDGNVTYYTVANDSAGNTNATPKYIVTIDTKNATLTNILVSGITDKAAIVTFTSDRQVNATVTTGGISNTYDTNTSNSTFGTSRTVNLVNLNASTTYFFRVYTWNLASNFTDSGQYNFTTTAIDISVGSTGSSTSGGFYYPTPMTPAEKVAEAVNQTVQKVRNLTAPKASILYITQDTASCWIHKVASLFPRTSPDTYDPCFPSTLYSGAPVQVFDLAYFTPGTVLSYTWWAGSPDSRIQPPKSALDISLRDGAYPVGVDIATSTGQNYNFSSPVNVVPGLPPERPPGEILISTSSDAGRASLSMVGGLARGIGGGGNGGASDENWDEVIWTNGLAVVTKGQAALFLFGGLGYFYSSGRGGKRRR